MNEYDRQAGDVVNNFYEINALIVGMGNSKPVVNYIRNMADVEQTLQKLLEKILDEINYKPRETKIKAITSDGANFTSALFLIDVTSPNRDDLKLFAKVACVGEKMRSKMNADWLYDTERFVYTQLIKIYKDIENEMNVPDKHRFRFPKLYGYSAETGEETVVMENLVESGYGPFNRMKSVDWAQASASIENLAKFHALSFAFSKHYPEKFEKLTVDLKYKMSGEGLDDETKELWQKMIGNSLEAIDKNLHAPIIKILDGCKEDWAKYNTPIGQPVIVHGDYRQSNLLFRKQGDVVDVISLDYQTVYAGTPVCDIIYFIVLSTDEEFRKQYYDELLAHYYAKLEEALRRLSVEPSEVYPIDKYYSDIKKILPFAVVLGATVLPLMTAESENVPQIGRDHDINDFIMTPNELCAKRFKGIINDCVKWGVL